MAPWVIAIVLLNICSVAHRISWWAGLQLMVIIRLSSNGVSGNRLPDFHVNNIWSTFFIMSKLLVISLVNMDIFKASRITSSELGENMFRRCLGISNKWYFYFYFLLKASSDDIYRNLAKFFKSQQECWFFPTTFSCIVMARSISTFFTRNWNSLWFMDIFPLFPFFYFLFLYIRNFSEL